MSSAGSTISSALKSTKNPNNDTVKSSRIGAGDDDVVENAYKAFKSVYAQTVFSSSRRKRAGKLIQCF